jgi:SAM-dependent methyltransferase
MEIVKQVQEQLKATNHSWDDLWKQGLTPWDLGRPTPLLIEELKRHPIEANASSLRTLVPGCGSGYDIATLVEHHEALFVAEHFLTESVVIGLDISPTSLERATQVVKAIDKGNSCTRVDLKCGDFFQNETNWKTVYTSHHDRGDDGVSPHYQGDCKFDFIFDYTFFCALTPALRRKWGEAMSSLLRPDTGRLFTIIFPILPGEDRSKGPPYPVTIDDYRSSLEPVGFVAESEPYASPHTVPSRDGKELCCYWTLKRSACL